MEMLRYIGLPDQSLRELTDILLIATALNANHPICTPIQKQGVEKTPPLLLGSVSEVR